jgi:hypothetical protein
LRLEELGEGAEESLRSYFTSIDFWSDVAFGISELEAYADVDSGGPVVVATFVARYPDFMDIEDWIARKLAAWDYATLEMPNVTADGCIYYWRIYEDSVTIDFLDDPAIDGASDETESLDEGRPRGGSPMGPE